MISLALLALWACSPDIPAAQELIEDLRILGIRSQPPEVRPGQQIELSALIANPKDAAVQLRWYACRNQGDANLGCADKSNGIYLGEQGEANYKVPANFFPKDAPLLDQVVGKYLPITLVARTADREVIAVKRVVVSRFPSNDNPQIADLSISTVGDKPSQSQTWKAIATHTYRMSPQITAESQQTYLVLDPKGQLSSAKENLVLSWYITGGSLINGRLSYLSQPDKQWVAPADAQKASQVSLFLVLRDGRGGIHWLTRKISIE
jgi:hypothetical protein